MIKLDKVFISIDMEGISTIVDWAEVDRNNSEYPHTRKIMAQDLNAAIEGALEAGAKEIVVSDAHGGMRNLRPEDVHEAAYLIRGSPKPNTMMKGISEGDYDAALYVGYHSMKGTKHGICAHTISGSTVQRININGRETGEFGLNSALAGYYGVPSVFLAGDFAATKEAEAFVPGITTATVKWAYGRYSAKCLPPIKSAQLIKSKAKEALTKELPAPRIVEPPIEVNIEFTNAVMADVVSLLPSFNRMGGVTVRGTFYDYQIAINTLRAAIYLASGTIRR
jgi:D-amino peptidase